MSKVTLEIAVFSVPSALDAIQAGAHRIELCENPNEGGTTPSYGILVAMSKQQTVPVFPIIRPRGGDFLYTDIEFQIMKQDLLIAKELGFKGVVIGLLNSDGSIDKIRTAELVALAQPMLVTFHRAFDRCADPIQGLEDIIATGCHRILTSGQVPNVANALPLIKQLVDQANGRIIIMPGSGVRANNINEILQQTGVFEIHSSARKNNPSKMEFNVTSMNENLQSTGVDSNEIKMMLAQF
ncbi:MAG: copper homeostasis protein CutC [Chitinophagaceae bacterium]|nr:copper homeostasis protein CutC [Chitinophagaceae bacterium]